MLIAGEGIEDHMLVSCEVAGKKENCTNFFTRIPTDSGMCCALNWENALKSSDYKQLVEDMQQSKADMRMQSRGGEWGGLRLVLDLHSNLVSFGTLNQDYDAFKIFVGQSDEFPTIKQRSERLEPGREHFVKLSAKVSNKQTSIQFYVCTNIVSSSGDLLERGHSKCCPCGQAVLLRR